jgi:alkylation response protein AidB-like acyl-CoA dehydrogenase
MSTAQAELVRVAPKPVTPTAIPVLKDRDAALAAVRALAPAIAAQANRTETERVVPKETIEALLDSGLFSIATPKIFGGSELGRKAMIEVASEISSVCGSTGWVYAVVASHNYMLGLFPREAQMEVFSDPRALTCTVFRLNGNVEKADGGYRLTNGQGRFCSGIDHAKWVIVGSPLKTEGAPPKMAFFLVPASEVEIIDDWFTAGMRGTGSKTIAIKDAFIPEHRVIWSSDIAKGTTPGGQFHDAPVYKLPTNLAQAFSLVGAPLGMAKGALAAYAAELRKKYASMAPERIGEESAVFARLAMASADIDSAYTMAISAAERIDEEKDPSAFTLKQRLNIRRDIAYAAQKARMAVNSLFESSGGSGIYDTSKLQRFWRDINASTAHVAFGWDSIATSFGRGYLDLPLAAGDLS